ncbi:MAG: carboxypeptidase regulatory-like domain-containing protein [Vicinamibacterales bacterium]
MTKQVASLGLVFAFLAYLPPGATAQTATGQITGNVTDTSGALVTGVRIKITNTLTGLTRETSTSDLGTYAVPLLPVGTYLVSAEKDGFKLAASSDNELNVDQVLRVDLRMELGALTESVEVRGRTVALDTETASIGHVITERQVTELPLNGRNFLQLLFLGNGAVETSGEQGAMRQGAGNAISINGSRPTSNNYLLDGTSNTDTALGTPAAILSVDAIQEFKEQTATYSAEYGFSANQISIVSKTGTNRLSGSVFSFMRNDKLDARSFFDVQKQKLDQKQFGFVVGGPVYVPGAYNGRNRTFFLVNYEGLRREVGTQDFLRVPLPDELAGRFSSQIIDPVTKQPFPGNVVPASRFSRLANLAMSKNYWPAPNASVPQGNYIRQRDLPTDTNQLTLRFDQQLGAKWGTVFGRYTQSDWTNTTLGTVTDLGDVFFVQETKNWQVSHSVPVGSNLVNQLRVGFVGARANQHGFTAPDSDIASVGLTGVFENLDDEQRTYPAVGFGGTGTGLAGGGSAVNDYQASYQPMWDLSNTTTWIRGRHTLNFGANYRRWSLQRDLANDFLGQFTFSGFFTGNAVADMLLGYYSGASVFQPAGFSVAGRSGNPREFNFRYFAPYVQDDWRVNPKLTLNLGLRWDYRTIPFETNDRMGWRDVNNPRGGLLVADSTLVDRGIVGDESYYKFAGRRNPKDASKNVFAPRLGFAFRPFGGQETVIRGGYGVFWDSFEGREIDGAADIYPYVSRGNYIQTADQTTPLKTTNDLFPSFADLGPATAAANTFLAVSMSPDPKNPYVQQWSLGIQREVFRNTIAEVNYIGTKGTDLLMRRNIAQALPYDPANPLPVAARKPYPNFVVYIDSDFSGTSNYQSLNTKLERHTNSLVATLVYTWAKSTDNKSAAAGIGASAFNGWQGLLDNSRPELDRGRSDFDVDHRLVGSFVYNLPFGKGERFAGDATGLKNALVGGWQVNGILTLQRGFPITITAADAGGLNDSFGTNRADIVGDPYPSGFEKGIDAWFNTAAFAQPAPGSFGTVGRNTLRGPGINNLDFALFKNFDLVRGSRLQFRFESFNAFNHAQFNAPVVNVADNRFGRILSARPGRINQLGLKLLF